MIKNINYLFVTCFGIGSFRFAPGTITSLVTTIFFYSLFHIINLSSNIILIILIVIFIYSFYAVSAYIKNNEDKDPKEVVIDEFIGQSIPVYLYEISHGSSKDPNEVVIEGGLSAPMPGKILNIKVKKNNKVKKGDTLITLEAMKMEHSIKANTDGVVEDVFVKAGEQVENGSLLMKIN